MKRLRRILFLAAVLAPVLLAGTATAKHPATVNQRAAIERAVEGNKFPAGCAIVYISSVNRNWGSFQYIGNLKKAPPKCTKYAADGIVILHLAAGHWHQVSAGSAFQCPIAGREVNKGQPNVPNRVANDLVPYLHCR